MSTGRGGDTALRLWGIGYVVVGVVLATAFAWPIYDSVWLAVVAASAAVLTLAIVLATTRFHWRFWAVALLTIGVYAVAVVPLAVPTALGSAVQALRGVGDGIAGVVVGWKQLLTLSLPLGEYQAVLVPFFVTVFLGSLCAFFLVLPRPKYSTLAVPVVFVMCAFGMVFGSSATGVPLVVAGVSVPAPRLLLLASVLLLASLVWLIGRTRLVRASALRAARAQTTSVRQRAESVAIATRRNTLAVALVVVALVAGLAIAPAAATLGTRQALRDRIEPVLVLRQQPSPLSAYRSWFDSTNYKSELFSVAGDTAGVDRIRLATLDSYDGEDFHVSGAQDGESGRFSRLPRTSPTSSGQHAITISIASGYSGIWVPIPAGIAAAPTFMGPRAEELSDAFYITASGASAIDVVADSNGARGLEPKDSYRVYADPPQQNSSTLGSGTSGKSLLSIADYPAMAEWVKMQQLPHTAQGFADAVTRLRARGYLSHSIADSAAAKDWVSSLTSRAAYVFQPSYSGNSRARIETVFTSLSDQQRRAGKSASAAALVSAVGDDEQFATAAALLARYWGYQSRVVMGVRLTGNAATLGVAPCASSCTGANVSAWIEASAPGGSWVTFDATPQFSTAPLAISDGQQLPKNPTVPQQQNSDVINPPQVDRDSSDSHNVVKATGDDWFESLLPVLRATGLSLLTLLLLVLPVLVLVWAKVSRRRWRRAARVPEVSIIGAWNELVDRYIDYGVALPQSATRSEMAEAAASPGMAVLAQTVDRAVFAEHPSGRDASVTSWELYESEYTALRLRSTRWQRFKARVSPASFVRQLDPSSVFTLAVSLFHRKESAK